MHIWVKIRNEIIEKMPDPGKNATPGNKSEIIGVAATVSPWQIKFCKDLPVRNKFFVNYTKKM